MSGRVGHRKRLICVNAANLRANHLYPTGHGKFFAKHGIKPGDTIAIERVGSHRFRVLPFEAKEERQHPAVFLLAA